MPECNLCGIYTPRHSVNDQGLCGNCLGGRARERAERAAMYAEEPPVEEARTVYCNGCHGRFPPRALDDHGLCGPCSAEPPRLGGYVERVPCSSCRQHLRPYELNNLGRCQTCQEASNTMNAELEPCSACHSLFRPYSLNPLGLCSSCSVSAHRPSPDPTTLWARLEDDPLGLDPPPKPIEPKPALPCSSGMGTMVKSSKWEARITDDGNGYHAIQVEHEEGHRYISIRSFGSFSLARTHMALVVSYLRAGADPKTSPKWSRVSPMYGSAAWAEYGEADQVALEQSRDAEEEGW